MVMWKILRNSVFAQKWKELRFSIFAFGISNVELLVLSLAVCKLGKAPECAHQQIVPTPHISKIDCWNQMRFDSWDLISVFLKVGSDDPGWGVVLESLSSSPWGQTILYNNMKKLCAFFTLIISTFRVEFSSSRQHDMWYCSRLNIEAKIGIHLS